MTMKNTFRTIAIASSLVAASVLVDGVFHGGVVISDAQARVGRPMTPVSVAGVARRTTRRTIRRTSIYAATLPRGCSTVIIEGTSLHQCGGSYYQPYGNQYVVVNVD